MGKDKIMADKYDKMTNETLNKAYADFLEGIKKEAEKKKSKYAADISVADKAVFDPNDYVIPMDSFSKYSKLGTTSRYYGDYVDAKTMINGYEIKPELMDKIKSFEDFNVFLENCKNNVIEDSNRQKTVSTLSRTIGFNYEKREIQLLIDYLQEMLKKESN